MALIDPADLTAMQGTLDPTRAELAITRAEDYLRVELGVEFDRQARTLVDRLPGTCQYIALPGPLVSVESVTVDGIALPAGAWIQTRRGISCPAGLGQGSGPSWVTVEVAFTAGFLTAPSELGSWGLYLAQQAYDSPKPGRTSTTITVEGVSATEQFATDDSGATAALALPEEILRGLRARHGSGRLRTGTVRIR